MNGDNNGRIIPSAERGNNDYVRREAADIDALLRSAAEDGNAEVDFDGIRARAVEHAGRRRARRRLICRLAAAVVLAMGIGAAAAVLLTPKGHDGEREALEGSTPDVVDLRTAEPQNTAETEATRAPSHRNPSLPSKYTRCRDVGVPYTSDFKSISDAISLSLPEYMNTVVDSDAGSMASKGIDDDGDEVAMNCTMVETPPYDLDVGEVGEFECYESIVMYWQLDDDSCLEIKLNGFGTDDADRLISDVSEKITGN